ncbi:MAG: fibronectin type III domain-containing protein [bacterium]|nr:fibronectin type III domain-containing protein [bacterium]
MKNIYYVIVFALAITALASGFDYSQLTQAKAGDAGLLKNNTSTVQIELKNPIALDALFAGGNNTFFDEIILESNFTVNNEAVHDFYVVDPKNKKNIKEDYIKNRKAFLADVKGINQLSSGSSGNIENILITKITVTGENSSIDQIKKGLVVDKINVKNNQHDIALQTRGKTAPKEAYLSGSETISTAALTTTPMYLSLPTSGTSYFYPSSYGGRYTQQNMIWNTINFASDQTYEHKIILYNYDRKTYLDGNSTSYPGCYPTTTYAATSWPAASKPYIDTRFMEPTKGIGCEIDELSYTIGAAQADALQANTNYYTYIRTADGNDASDKFKLQGQVGYRSPSFCYTTWCSAKYKIYTLIPAWSTAVPGTQSWTYNGQVPDAPSNVSVTNPTATSLQVNFTDNTYDETNIWIERKTGTGGSWVSLGSFGALVGAYDELLPGAGKWYWINSSLSSMTQYCYRLKATNNIGGSAYSNEACGITY